MSSEALIVLCPGQGAQHVGMGAAWAARSPAAAAIFDEAEKILGLPLRRICFEGPAEELNRTNVAQAAIYTASVACWRALIAAGRVDPAHLVAAGGLSLGEYTALHLAGVVDFATGLKLVAQRGQFMQEAAENSQGGMVALIGADENQAMAVCQAAAGDGVLVPANFNCPGQIVLSGSRDACQRALAESEKAGLRAQALVVAGAFHSPLMEPAARRMEAVLASVPLQTPRIPVMSNVTGAAHDTEPDQIRRLLVQQITQPVRWEQNMQWLVKNHPGRYIEPAPGKVLSGLMRRTDRSVRVENHAEPET